MKPHTATPGRVDGAWWPRSHDPAREFPGLVLAMSSWVGPVRQVAYHVDDWDKTTRELTVEDWSVTLVDSPVLDANTVVLTGSNQRRMMLLVVPPDTPGGLARAVLSSAARSDTVAGVEEILMSNGIRLGRRTVSDTLGRSEVVETGSHT
ncbi:DUF5994 family protein [Actinophytocola sp.]|uniref:DUF5994 family protein n=1 Tax=Actinophytocola sp. TaxID=1872138 RepID=UPI002D7F6FBD|nr:DUF5994 family protein [Actinophytocola sp.]HET9140381.1 DUF5994 family protein [Actinophytocola sp.]